MTRLADFSPIVVLCGPGLADEAGLRPETGPNGLFAEHDREEVADLEAFEDNPDRVWDFHEMRRELCLNAEPGGGHRALAEIAAERPELIIVTTAMDGLLQRAGVPAERVIELHGSLFRARCTALADEAGVSGAGSDSAALCPPVALGDEWMPERFCRCGAWLRPDALWSGEEVDSARFEAASDKVSATRLVLGLGLRELMFPAAGLISLASEAGATMIEIDTVDGPVSPLFEYAVRGGLGAELSALWDADEIPGLAPPEPPA